MRKKNLDAKFFVNSFNKNVADKLPGGSSDLNTIQTAINGISSSEGTNISKGLYESLKGVNKDSTIMVLLSDGEATWATTADGKTTYGPTYGNGVSNATKENVKKETKAALQTAVASVSDIYAISIFQTDAAVSEVITKTLSAVDGASLAANFGAIADEIKKNATSAKLIAEVGKYVAFSKAVDAEGKTVESVKPAFKDAEGNIFYGNEPDFTEDGKTRIFVWDIPAPASLDTTSTEEGITSPIIEFTITATADDLIDAWKNGDDQVSVEIVTDDDGNTLANITLTLTATTTLSYTQTIKDTTQNISETKTVDLEVQSFITKTAAIAEVPISDTLTVNYFIDNNEKPIATTQHEVPYGYEITYDKTGYFVTNLGNVVDDENFDASMYAFSEITFDNETLVIDVYYVSMPLTVDYTVKYICEEEIDEANDKNGVVAEYSDSAEENTPIVIKSFDDVDALEGVNKANYVVIPDQEYNKTVGDDNHEFIIWLAKVPDIPVVEEVKVAIMYRYAADGTVAAPDVVETGKPGETYSVTSPTISNYTARTLVVSGTFKEDDEIVVYYDKNEPVTPPSDPTPSPIPPVIIITTPTPSPVPTEAPTPVPTEVPTEEPTPTPEPVVEVEEPETPEGDVEIDEIETPEGAPEEELDVEPIDTPQGDLPKTGVLPTYAFIGIGAACVLFGSILVIKRRKEEN